MFRTLCVLALLAASPFAFANTVWKITTLNWPPYTSDQMTNEGNSIQQLRLLLRQHNIELIVEFYPWQRAMKIAEGSAYLGYFPAWPEEVKTGFVPSKPVSFSDIGLISMKAEPIKFNSIDDLFGRYRIGLIRSYVYPADIEQAMLQHEQNTYTTLNETMLLNMFVYGRFDVAITDPLVLSYIAEKQGIPGLHTQQLLYRRPLVFGLRDKPDNQANISLLNTILAKAEAER